MLHVVRIGGEDGIVLAYPEVDPRSGELRHMVAVAAQGYHAREIASTAVAGLLASVADPAAWHRGATAMVRHALASVEPLTVHGGVRVSVAVALAKGRAVETAYSGDLQIRCASAAETRWIVPGVKHGEEVTSATYRPTEGDAITVLSVGILEEIPPQELLSAVLSTGSAGAADMVETRMAASKVPQLFCAARFGGPPSQTAVIPSPAPRKIPWRMVTPIIVVVGAAVAAGLLFARGHHRASRLPAPVESPVPAPLPVPSPTPPSDSAAAPSGADSSPAPLQSPASADTQRATLPSAGQSPPGSLAWRQRIGGANFSSSPVLAGVKVYVGSKDQHLYCLLASSGEVLWKFKTGGGIGSSPAVDSGSVYFGSYDSTFYCVDRHSGRGIWKQRTGAGIGASPLLHDGAVFCGCKDGRVYAWDARSGIPRWRFETQKEVWARPLAVGPRLFIGSIDERFYCLDCATGELKWAIPVDGAVYTNAAVGPDSTVVFGTNKGTVYQVRQRDGSIVWKATYGPIYSSPLVHDGMLYFGCKGGDFRCVALADHREVWTYTTGADIRSSPTRAGDTVLIGSYDGRLYAFSTGGKLRWSFDTESRIYSTPAVEDGRVYFGDMTGWFYCLGG